MHRLTACALALGSIAMSGASLAQDLPLTAIAKPSAANQHLLPANTEVRLRTNQEVTTKGKTWAEGDTFDLSVTHDVALGNYVVIPAGSRGVGRITWLTNKGAFGKSGKMDIELEYIEVGGRRVDIDGTYRQEGEGNTVATVAGVIAAGVFAGFITGRSGTIPQGRELVAYTSADLPVELPRGTAIQTAAALETVEQGPIIEALPGDDGWQRPFPRRSKRRPTRGCRQG